MLLKLKVTKSQKQFLESLILPKNKQKTWKNYAKNSQDNFFSCFVRFWEELWIPIFFWDLLTLGYKKKQEINKL